MKSIIQLLAVIFFFSLFWSLDAFSPASNKERFSFSLEISAAANNGSKRTLYDVLGGSPTDTRAELKKRYVILAKMSHPDAVGHRVVDSDDGEEINFCEIAAAWSILSDVKERRKYDRSLQAEEFTRNVEIWAGDIAKKLFKKKSEREKMTASAKTTYTVTGLHEAAEKVQNYENNESVNLSTKHEEVRVAQHFEKAKELEDRAARETKEAILTREQLQEVVNQRLMVALHTKGSGLTAAEANILFDKFNMTVGDHISPLDRALLRHTCHQEIAELKERESDFIMVQKEDTKAQETYAAQVQRRMDGIEKLQLAKEEENEARLRWEEAKEQTSTAKKELANVSRELVQTKIHASKIDAKMERQSMALSRQSEIVRNALKRKERLVIKKCGRGETVPDEASSERLTELNELRQKESSLSETAKMLEAMAADLLSEAKEIKSQMRELDGVAQYQ